MSAIPRTTKNLLYIYDLPHNEYTSTQLAKIIKEKANYDIDRLP